MTTRTRRLDGKVALVTGASSGIGRAAARGMAAEGAAVVVAARREARLRELAASIEQDGGRALAVPADVTSADDVAALHRRATEAFGRLDVAFNNAGVGIGARLHEAEEADYDAMMDVNVKGVWLCMRAQLRIMLEQGSGVIVNNASVSALITDPGGPIYGASKAAVVSLTRSAAKAYGPDGIRVNALCPGYTDSEMTAGLQEPAARQRAIERTPLRRIAGADEMAEMVVWLASDAARFVTGEALVVDGGIGL